MEQIEFARINGVEVRNLVELDYDEPLYSGEIYVDGKAVGTFTEAPDAPMTLDVEAAYKPVLGARINDYLAEVSDDGEELDREVFFLDLIQLELYLRSFREGVEEGYPVLLVSFGEDQVDTYCLESEEQAEKMIRENKLERFQIFVSEEDFVLTC